MTLFSLARRNVQGNVKSYLIYFASMIFSVVIYYTFISLRYSKEIAENSQKWEGMRSVFLQASIILILFAAVFIWYSNSFFTKKRKKEIGLYSLLGVRKRTIGTMLFYENTMMGAFAIAIGIVLGSLLSKLFALLFLKLLNSTVDVSFSVSPDAILNTVIVFAAIILITSVHSYRLIYRFQLVQLFQAEQEGERAPKPSAITAIIAVLLIAVGYWTVFQPMATGSQMARNFLIIFASIIAGTYLLFRSAIIYLLKLAQNAKSHYYKGMNMVSLSQLLYRIQGNTRLFTMIALLSALTLCAVTVGASSYYTLTDDAEREAPFSYMHVSQGEAFDKQVRDLVHGDPAHPVSAELDVPILRLKADLSDFFYNPTGFVMTEVPVKLLSVSTYNRTSEALNRADRLEVSGNETILIQPMYSTFAASDVVGDTFLFPLEEGPRKVEVTGLVQGRMLPWGFPDVCLIVSDSLYDELRPLAGIEPVTYKAYKADDQMTSKQVSDALQSLRTDDNAMSTFYYQYRLGMESAGMNIFTLGFLGLVFLAATGCMIYFKQLTDATTDKKRYEILRKIGVSRKEIRASVAKQTLFVFLLPLVLGVVHTCMIVNALASIQLIGGNLIVPILISVTAYAVIYLGYYILCLNSYNRIVNKG